MKKKRIEEETINDDQQLKKVQKKQIGKNHNLKL